MASLFPLSVPKNSLFGLSALKAAAFLCCCGQGIYGPEGTMDLAAVAVSAAPLLEPYAQAPRKR